MRKPLQEQIPEYVYGYSRLKNFSQRTVYNKQTFYNRLLSFLNGRELVLETARDYVMFLAMNGCTVNTIATTVKNIRAFSNWQASRGYAPSFATSLEQPKQQHREIEYLPPEIIEKIIHAGTEPKPCMPKISGDNKRHCYYKAEARLCLRFILRTGLRISEAKGMKGSDLNIEDASYWVTRKGGKQELMPLPLDLLPELKGRTGRERVFDVSQELCNEAIQRGAIALGIKAKLSNHILRHIFATSLVKEGKPIQQISRLMGHASVVQTDKTYTHLNIADIARTLNSSPVVRQGLEPKDVLSDISILTREKIARDERFRIAEMSTQDRGEETELIIRIFAKKQTAV
jgi:site-specific recombinase XerD